MSGAVTIESQTYRNLAAHADAMARDMGLPVAMPDVDFTPPAVAGRPQPYLRVTYTPAGAQLDSLGFPQVGEPEDATLQGLLQVSVLYPQGRGLLPPAEVAGAVAVWFRPGTRLDGGGVSVYVDRRPDVGPSLEETDLVQVPVTVRWRSTQTPT